MNRRWDDSQLEMELAEDDDLIHKKTFKRYSSLRFKQFSKDKLLFRHNQRQSSNKTLFNRISNWFT
jgi:hypothetical protein